jgi:predicted ATP-dependent endonuclease of OLD family
VRAGLLLKRVEFWNFKAFERFTVNFKRSAYMVGPNNAGKSTIIAAIRTCALMLRWAGRRNPNDIVRDRDSEYHAYSIAPGQFALVDENLRHEFRERETRVVVHFQSHAKLTAVWPAEDDENERFGFFYLEQSDGWNPRTAADVRRTYPEIGIVPMLTPLEQQEAVHEREYVRRNVDGRLASRHFRNQLYGLETLDSFLEFAHTWTPELAISRPVTAMGPNGQNLDCFYREAGRRAEKELFWAGDGIQVWLQLLFHIARVNEAPILLLDEPDLYLHPDLQRRLVRLLEGAGAQTITATHSPEILAEVPPTALIWVDKTNRRAVTAPDEALLGELASAIGTQFNIRLAKALRSRVVLFVEGDDMKLLRAVAETLGATRLARELDVAIVPLGGYSRATEIEPFRWLNEHFLKESVQEWVVLDRDYRSEPETRRTKAEFTKLGIKCHVWKRKELESYLLAPRAMSKLSGADADWVADQLENIAAGMKTRVQSALANARQGRERDQSRREQILREALEDFDALWAEEENRLDLCPAKEVLSQLNQRLQASGKKAVSAVAIAREMREDEIPAEMAAVLRQIEDDLALAA